MASSDYKASNFDNTIVSKSTLVPSDHQLEYQAGDTIKFDVPAFMGFIDPRQSYLKMKVKVDSRLPMRFSKNTGCQSIINNLRIYDGTQSTQIENLENYTERLEKEYHYSQNPSVRRRRGLIEGVEGASNTYNFQESQLCDTFLPVPPAAITSAQDPLSVAGQPLLCCNNTLDICLPLSSGVLGGHKIFPAALTQGLKVEIDTNQAKKILEVWNKQGLSNGNSGAVDSANDSRHFGIIAHTGGTFGAPAIPLTQVKLYADFPTTENVVSLNPNKDANTDYVAAGGAANAVSNVRNGCNGASNLIVGNVLRGSVDDGTIQNLGTISSVSWDALFQAVVINFAVGTGYTPLVGTANVGRLNYIAPHPIGICWVGDVGDDYVNYRLSDIELVLKTAQPPKAYVEKLMKQTMSDEGAEIDIKTYQTFRNNIQAGDTTSQINLPSYNERAVSIYCCPYDLGLTPSVMNENLQTSLDTILDYQFIVNGTGQPTRKVSCEPLTRASSTTAQVQLWEMEKSLTSAKNVVRNLKDPQKNFMVARALARYGGVYDLKADGSISLKQDYSAPTKNKLMISFIAHLRRISVSKMGLVVEL